MGYNVDPKMGGDGIHRYIIGAAILEALEDRHDEVRFSTSVETAVSLAADLVHEYKTWWDKAMSTALLTETGKPIYDEKGDVLLPNAEISKASRQRQLGALMLVARKGGVFSKRKTGFDKKALDFFKAQSAAATAESEASEHEDGDDGDDHDDGED